MSDPDAIRLNNWKLMSHQELYDVVRGDPNTSASESAAALWDKARVLYEDHDARASAAVKISQGDWAGATADAMSRASQSMSSWVQSAISDAQSMVAGVKEQGTQAAYLYNTIPPPAPAAAAVAAPTGNNAYAEAVGQQVAQAQAQARTDAANEAARAKELMLAYDTRSQANRTELGIWTVPPTATVSVADPNTSNKPGVTAHSRIAPSVAHTSAAAASTTGVAGVAGPTPQGSLAPTPHVNASGADIPSVAGGSAAAAGQSTRLPSAPTNIATAPGNGAASARGIPAGGVSTGGGGSPLLPGAAGGGLAGGAARTRNGGPVTPINAIPAQREVESSRALSPGAGGRGLRPSVPPAASIDGLEKPGSGWRELVSRSGGGEPTARPLPPSSAEPRSPFPGEPTPAGTRSAAGGASTGMMPMGGGAGGQQERTHRRPAYLVDDGAFDVHVPCTDGVITGEDEF